MGNNDPFHNLSSLAAEASQLCAACAAFVEKYAPLMKAYDDGEGTPEQREAIDKIIEESHAALDRAERVIALLAG